MDPGAVTGLKGGRAISVSVLIQVYTILGYSVKSVMRMMSSEWSCSFPTSARREGLL